MPTFNGWNIISLPTYPPAPKSIEWRALDVIGETASPFSLQKQFQDWGQGRLAFSASYPFMRNSTAAAWRGFLAALRGKGNIFQFGDPLNQAPQNPLATGGTVSGAGQTGFTLVTTSSGLLPGDWIQIGFRLYMVTSVSGGTLGIWPNIRESPGNGATVIITNTQGVFRLTSNDRNWTVDTQRMYSITFEAEEAL